MGGKVAITSKDSAEQLIIKIEELDRKCQHIYGRIADVEKSMKALDLREDKNANRTHSEHERLTKQDNETRVELSQLKDSIYDIFNRTNDIFNHLSIHERNVEKRLIWLKKIAILFLTGVGLSLFLTITFSILLHHGH